MSASQHTLLEVVAVYGPISRAGLAECTGLSPPAVSMLSRGQVDGGLLPSRHCEPLAARECPAARTILATGDCHVAALLAMTETVRVEGD